MGTPDFAIPSLDALLKGGVDVCGVVTGPDRARGRGRVVSPTPVAVFAQGAGLPLIKPERLTDEAFTQQLTELQADIFVVVAFRILPPAIFRIPRIGSFNLHASLLPAYRGAAPINRAIMNGETRTGITTFLLAEKVDTGSILLRRKMPIYPHDDAGSLHDRLAEEGALLVLETVRGLERGKLTGKTQDDALASPAPKIRKEDCRIDWGRTAESIHNQVRGLSPYPAAFTTFRGGVLKIFRSTVTAVPSWGAPGTVRPGKESLEVCTGDFVLGITEIRPEGRKRMSVAEFLRGTTVPSGARLG